MSGCDPQTWNNITPEKFATIVKLAASHGLNLSGESSSLLQFDHCTFAWSYDATAQTLMIRCGSKPFFVDCDTIHAKLNEMLDMAVGTSP